MAANLGATTYTAVTWTTGDVLTEAKLDNMVANDQAYDSHAAQGVLANNNLHFAGRDAGDTTNYGLIRLNSSDKVELGDSGITDYIVGASPLAQDHTALARASRNSTQSITTATWTKVQLDDEDFDPGGNYDNVTNYRFTAPVTGYYQVSGNCGLINLGSGKYIYVAIYKNGVANIACLFVNGTSGTLNTQGNVSGLVQLDATDYVELYVQHNHGSSLDTQTNAAIVWMSVTLIGV